MTVATQAPAPTGAPDEIRPARRRRGRGSRFDTALGWGAGGPGRCVVRVLLCVAVLFLFAAPFVTILVGAFDATPSSTSIRLLPDDPSLRSFQVAQERGISGYLVNSLVVVGGGLLLQLAVSVLTAYALARFTFRGRTVMLLVFLLTMMLPEEVIAVPLVQVIGDLPLLGFNLRGTPLGVILPVAVWGFSILVMTEFMRQIPEDVLDAARMDGAGQLRMLWSIVLPLSRPVLGVATIFGFMMIWDQYLLPLLVANDQSDYTLTVALSVLRQDPEVGPGVLLAGAVLALVPSLVVYLLMQRSLIAGIMSGATKG